MSGLPEDILFTKNPHFIDDDLMPRLSASEYKIVSFICRKTFGFQKMVDKIALSQFEAGTGSARNTIIKALKSLEEKGIIKRSKKTVPHSYSIIIPKHNNTKPQRSHNTNDQSGSKNELPVVQKVNPSPVQKMNPQKKAIKEKEINTTTGNIEKAEILKVANRWNEIFDDTLDIGKRENLELIARALEHFNTEELYQAMFFRSKADFYQNEKHYLRNKPNCFFKYPETIQNDFRRKPPSFFTHDEMINLVTSKGYDHGKFSSMKGIKDSEGKQLYEYNGPIYS